MNIEEIRDYCLSLPHATEAFPFDDETIVFRVGDPRPIPEGSLPSAHWNAPTTCC